MKEDFKRPKVEERPKSATPAPVSEPSPPTSKQAGDASPRHVQRSPEAVDAGIEWSQNATAMLVSSPTGAPAKTRKKKMRSTEELLRRLPPAARKLLGLHEGGENKEKGHGPDHDHESEWDFDERVRELARDFGIDPDAVEEEEAPAAEPPAEDTPGPDVTDVDDVFGYDPWANRQK